MAGYPRTIDNGAGESLTFVRLVHDARGAWLDVENTVQPGAGPPMHVHHRQEEAMTIVHGRMGVQVQGEDERFYEAGQSVAFPAGVAHRFWNAGQQPLVCRGSIRPADNVEYFLSEIFASAKASGGAAPGMFDAAYLMRRYRSEFDMTEIPAIVKKLVFPVVVVIGTVIGRYRKYRDAPEPRR